MNECIFCKIIRGELPAHRVYEDEHTIAFLDINPVNRGHTLVMPKQHVENIYEMSDEALSRIAPVLRDLARITKKAVSAEGTNIEMNNERPAGQIIDHAHIHIIPRFSDDGLRHWPGKKLSDEEMGETAKKIKDILQ